MDTLLLSPALYLLIVSVPLLVIDFREGRLPNKILLPVFPVWLISSVYYAVVSGDWLSSIVLPLAIAIPLTITLTMLSMKNILGMGDVKLLIAMGLSLSWKSLWVWVALPTTIVIAAALVLLVVALRNKHRHKLPLAPIMFSGYALITAILFIN